MQFTAACFLCLAVSTFASRIKENNNLESKVLERLGDFESYLKQQDGRIKELERTVIGQRKHIQHLETKLKQGEEEETRLSRGASALRPRPPSHVAFSTYLDHRMTNVKIDQIICFNKVILNDGAGYNNITGVFTCPRTGVYLFTFMVNTWVDAYQLVVKLVVDGVNQADGESDPFHRLQEVQGGNSVILEVKRGQSVWLAAYNTGNTMVDGREDYRFTTLSGVMLYPK